MAEKFSISIEIPFAKLGAGDSVIWIIYEAPWLIPINQGWEGEEVVVLLVACLNSGEGYLTCTSL